MLTVLMLHDESPELCFVPAGPGVAAGLLAPLREGHVPRLLLQEGAVEATEDAELGQRGGLFRNLSVYRTRFTHQHGCTSPLFFLMNLALPLKQRNVLFMVLYPCDPVRPGWEVLLEDIGSNIYS